MNGAKVIESRYSTSDLYFASYLKAAGVSFLNAEKEGRKVVFVFERVDSIRDLKQEYFNRTAKISALTFVDEIRNLKSLTYMCLKERDD